jgi:hypothetical protein
MLYKKHKGKFMTNHLIVSPQRKGVKEKSFECRFWYLDKNYNDNFVQEKEIWRRGFEIRSLMKEISFIHLLGDIQVEVHELAISRVSHKCVGQ